MFKRQILVIGLLLGVTCIGAAVAAPVDYAAKAHDLAEKLATSNNFDLQAALIQLSLIPPEGFDAIEKTAADPGLDPRAALQLKQFITLQKPWQEGRKRVTAAREADHVWNRDTALAAYEKSGTKNPAWDDKARKAIVLFVAPTKGWSKEAQAAIDDAINAGCNDPLIVYFKARVLSSDRNAELSKVNDLFKTASDALTASTYPAYRKLACYRAEYTSRLSAAVPREGRPKLTSEQWKPETKRLDYLRKEWAKQWPEFLKDNPPQSRILDLADEFLDAQNYLHKHREPVFKNIYEPWQKATPDTSEILAFKGHFYIKFAWDARGGGWANSVTENGWKQFGERLAIAEQALTQSWEKDHNNALAAQRMLTVELGQGKGRDRMELWYKRALAADPDDLKAVTAKMYYLEPKWHGSPQDMLGFAHELYDSHNWRGEFPFQIASAYEKLLAYVPDPKPILETPEVWSDLQLLYIPYLKVFPDDASIRSKYCYYACRCGHWDVAKKQFELLGDDAISSQFGGSQQMQGFKAEAAAK